MRPVLALAVVAAVTALSAACDGEGSEPSPSDSVSAPTQAAPAADVSILPARSGGDTSMRIDDGVTPPTNRWYSSLAFGEAGLPVFPKPLSFAPADGGFTMGLTSPEATANAIIAPARADLQVSIAGATGPGIVSAADPVGVTLDWGDASVSLAQGWPVVGVTAAAPVTATLSPRPTPASATLATIEVDGREYGVHVDGGTLDGSTLRLDAGGSAQLFAVPDHGDAQAFAASLTEVVTAVSWSGSVTGDTAATALDYGTPTILAIPSDRARQTGLQCSLGSYATIDGPYSACAASGYAWEVPAVEPRAELDLGSLSDDERDVIRAHLLDDAATIPPVPSDTYFGGKALARLANLMTLARVLGEDDAAGRLADALTGQLRDWGDPDRCSDADARCFAYDIDLEGVVGLTPSFGSEEFNDHHFHYGYLLYAAAIAVEHDPSLAEQIGPVFDLVARDIAGGPEGPMPPIRVFDPAAGHSWASGFSPFGDGNNQESSSEAVSAWNAVALWAAARGDASLERRATWLLAAEADAARRLWLAPDLETFPEFEHPIVAIEWGAKRDYATWFSPEPSAMLGIQILPASPAQATSLAAAGAERIEEAVREASGPDFDVMFGDYLLMYLALAGTEQQQEAWETALSLPGSALDDGNSRAYMLAWIATADD